VKKSNPELQRLLWLIDFINLDIDRLSKGDFQKLLIEMGENLRPRIDIPGLWGGKIRALLEQALVSSWLKDANLSLPERLRDRFDSSTLIIFVKEAQRRVKTVFDKIYEMKDYSGGDKEGENFSYIRVLEFNEKFQVTVGHGKIEVGPEEFAKGLEHEVAELLYRCSAPEKTGYTDTGFHDLSNLKRCQAPLGRATDEEIPRCGKYFWQVYNKMEKNYCSPTCAWRAAAWDRRQKAKAGTKERK
jgi:hypothetical protein